MPDKEYLGDSVYVEVSHNDLVLTTENGLPLDPSNTIVLDIDVYDALVRYVERRRKQSEVASMKGVITDA